MVTAVDDHTHEKRREHFAMPCFDLTKEQEPTVL